MIELQYESKFDGFLVDLRIGPAEELNQAMFGGEPVLLSPSPSAPYPSQHQSLFQ